MKKILTYTFLFIPLIILVTVYYWFNERDNWKED